MEEKRDYGEIRVGERVKALREQKGLSLKELADLTGFSTALLSQMENHLVSPSLGTIIKLRLSNWRKHWKLEWVIF